MEEQKKNKFLPLIIGVSLAIGAIAGYFAYSCLSEEKQPSEGCAKCEENKEEGDCATEGAEISHGEETTYHVEYGLKAGRYTNSASSVLTLKEDKTFIYDYAYMCQGLKKVTGSYMVEEYDNMLILTLSPGEEAELYQSSEQMGSLKQIYFNIIAENKIESIIGIGCTSRGEIYELSK